MVTFGSSSMTWASRSRAPATRNTAMASVVMVRRTTEMIILRTRRRGLRRVSGLVAGVEEEEETRSGMNPFLPNQERRAREAVHGALSEPGSRSRNSRSGSGGKARRPRRIQGGRPEISEWRRSCNVRRLAGRSPRGQRTRLARTAGAIIARLRGGPLWGVHPRRTRYRFRWAAAPSQPDEFLNGPDWKLLCADAQNARCGPQAQARRAFRQTRRGQDGKPNYARKRSAGLNWQ